MLSRLVALALLLLVVDAEARTGNQLIMDLRIMLGQTDSLAGRTNWTNAQLLQTLNIAQDKISARGRVIEKDTVYGTATSPEGGHKRLVPPSGFITLRGTAYLMTNSIEVKPIPVTSADSMYRQQQKITKQAMGERNYLIYEESDDIVVSPAFPSKDSVRVAYFAHPSTIVDTLECLYGDEWEVVLLYEAKIVACEKIRDETWTLLATRERDMLLEQTYRQDRLRPQLVKTP
jgi:hypothetical protein